MLWALIAAIVAVFVGVFVLRPRVAGLYKGDFQGVKTEAVVGPIVTLAVFLTAFVVAQATLTFQRTNQAVSQEAASVELLYENAGLLPDGAGDELQASAICYARSISNLEFPALAEGRTSPETEWWAGQFNAQVPEVLDGPGSVVGQIVSLNRQQTEARASRLFDAQPNLPVLTLTMLVIAIVGVLTVITTLAVPDMRRRVLISLALLLAVLLGGTLFLIEQLEEPFNGVIRVQPTAVVNAQARMESRLPDGEVLPCDDQGSPVNPEAQALAARGETPLVICSDVPFPPFASEDATSSSPSGYTGFDIDLAQSIANSSDRTLVVVDEPFDQILDAVRVGVCDAAVSAVTITPERAEQVDFSQPYLEVGQSLVVRSEQGTVASLADLSPRTVGVQAGTTGERFVEANRPAGLRILDYPSTEDQFAALRSGQVTGIVLDSPVADVAVADDPGLRVAVGFDTDEQYGIAVARDNAETLAVIERGLEQARADGTLDGLRQRYLGPAANGS